MIVYLAEVQWDYAQGLIVGVYSTEELALAAIAKWEKDRYGSGEGVVSEWELDHVD